MNEHLTIAILALNEAKSLFQCLDCIPSELPVHLIDSGSTDETRELAVRRGVRVHRNPWSGFAAQRNFALERCGIETEWTLFVDADERYPLDFFAWFDEWVETPASGNYDVGMIPSTLVFNGTPLRHAPGYPVRHPRLVRTATVRFCTNHTGHGESVPESARALLVDIPYEHHFYDGDLVAWMKKHVHLASLEVEPRNTPGAAITGRGRASTALRSSILRIPLRFVYHYLLRQGFRDGRAGFDYALMYAWFEASKYTLRRGADFSRFPPRP